MFHLLGPQPPKEIFEDLPEDVTVELAVNTWYSGYHDGHEKKTHHIFEHAHLQPIYDPAYERGTKDRAMRDELNNRPGVRAEEPQEEGDPRSVLGVLAAPLSWMVRHGEVVLGVGLVLAAVAIVFQTVVSLILTLP